ncbi:hypothetical protein [Emticicia sp. W12TSBA100-4]|uniref:hypothetical protein n=1 Tax=Emticicia sp. W12TSBA100-4 TaxID=3160965 RepID=UPI003305F0AE
MFRKAYFVCIFICTSCYTVFAQKVDTLYAQKAFLKTHIFKDSVQLSRKKVVALFHDTYLPKKKYKWANILKPVGPLVTLGGVGLTYVAFRGKNFITTVEGNRVTYKSVSLPQLSIGVGLVVLGYSIIESSKLLAFSSVNVYNKMLKEGRKTSYINNIQFGITDSKSIGFSISLK